MPPIKLQPLPFFKAGSLVFEGSGHVLRISDRHYRCDLNCRGLCKLKEPQIKMQNLERNFITYLKKFEIDADKSETVLDKLARENLVDIILGPDKTLDATDAAMDATLAAAAVDLQKKGRVRKQDFKDFEESLLLQRQMNYSWALAGMGLDVLRAITATADEPKNRAKTFARIIKALHISNEGKIVVIEFEPWGWYMIRLIDQRVEGYLDRLRDKGVKILNKPDGIARKKLSEAALYFATVMPNEALGQNVGAAKEWIGMISDMIRSLMKHDVKEANKMQLIMLGMMQNFPIGQMLTAIAPALEQKPRRSK